MRCALVLLIPFAAGLVLEDEVVLISVLLVVEVFSIDDGEAAEVDVAVAHAGRVDARVTPPL